MWFARNVFFLTTLILHFYLWMFIMWIMWTNNWSPKYFLRFIIFWLRALSEKCNNKNRSTQTHQSTQAHVSYIYNLGIRLEIVFVSAAFDLIVLYWVNTHVIYHPRSMIDAIVAILERVGIGVWCTLQWEGHTPCSNKLLCLFFIKYHTN